MGAPVTARIVEMLRQSQQPGDSRSLTELLEAALVGCTDAEKQRMLDDWSLWSLPHQRMPPGRWRRWGVIGGRGIGKSLTASKTIHEVAKDKDSLAGGVIAIVGRTHTDVRDVNIESTATGLLAAAPADFRPRWRPGPGTLEWPNGVRGRVFGAIGESAESIRGTNIAFGMGDEVAAWKNGHYVWWELLELACRVGRAQLMLTTTPRRLKWLRELAALEDTVLSTATTYDNPFLESSFVRSMRARFAGTSVEDQEIGGKFLDAVEGAILKDQALVSDARVPREDIARILATIKRVVVAVDPAVTANRRSDLTGVVVFGVDGDGDGYVFEDATDKYQIRNNEWAEVVVDLYQRYQADAVVAEVNRGGDLVEVGLRAVDRNINYVGVRATRGKVARARPVGGLYERGLIHHVGRFVELEDELTSWVEGDESPNRLDALVWGATYLMLDKETVRAWDTPLAYLGTQGQ